MTKTKGRAQREGISRKEESVTQAEHEAAHEGFREPDTQGSGRQKDLDSRTNRRQR